MILTYNLKHGSDPRNLVLDGQESNYGNLTMQNEHGLAWNN